MLARVSDPLLTHSTLHTHPPLLLQLGLPSSGIIQNHMKHFVDPFEDALCPRTDLSGWWTTDLACFLAPLAGAAAFGT